ncbi:MAG: WD40/YVTN/BNR-like repeat-containing protein [Salibacteraceae bacterium]
MGQSRNYNANLEVEGNLDRISPHPDGSIWLTTNEGFAYRAAAPDSLWYPWLLADKQSDSLRTGDPIKRIVWFNETIGLAYGNLALEEDGDKNIVYRTTDGGESWEPVQFGEPTWVYNAHMGKEGKAWLTGSSSKIYYTENYGEQWKPLKKTVGSSERLLRAYMLNDKEGLASGSNNILRQTSDNFESWTTIETPLDQGLVPESRFNKSITNILHFNDYWVVQQNNRLYFTKDNAIQWDTTSQVIKQYSLDAINNRLYGVDDSGYVYLIEDAMRLRKIHPTQRIESTREDIYALNYQLLVLDKQRNLHVIDDLHWNTYPLHTDLYPIAEPEVIRSVKDSSMYWGLTERDLYQSTDSGKTWFRAITLDMEAANLKVLDKEHSIAGDGEGKNYMVDLTTMKYEEYEMKNPLSTFFESPVVKMSIKSVSGNFNSTNEMLMVYELDVDQQLTLKTFTNGSSLALDSDKEIELWMPPQDPDKLTKVLEGVNANPESMPQINEFVILQFDIDRYLEKEDTKKARKKAKKDEEKRKELEFKREAVKRLDTVSAGTLKPALDATGFRLFTNNRSMTMTLENEDGMTLEVQSLMFLRPTAWHLPWTITVDDYSFKTYSLDLSRYVRDVTPNGFHYRWQFNNTLLVERIVTYWYNKENNRTGDLDIFLQMFSR